MNTQATANKTPHIGAAALGVEGIYSYTTTLRNEVNIETVQRGSLLNFKQSCYRTMTMEDQYYQLRLCTAGTIGSEQALAPVRDTFAGEAGEAEHEINTKKAIFAQQTITTKEDGLFRINAQAWGLLMKNAFPDASACIIRIFSGSRILVGLLPYTPLYLKDLRKLWFC